jgi:hypothetical protein
MRKVIATGLLTLGLGQMLGDLFNLSALKALATAATASPAPKVFATVHGLETFSTHFFIEWTDLDGVEHSLPITPEVYARLRGPYNRRNVYGAMLAYGPLLEQDPRTRPMFVAVARYALCGRAPVLREFGIGPEQIRRETLQIRLAPRTGPEWRAHVQPGGEPGS